MAGLLAANMLRRYNPIVLEAQDSLPQNHSALLRFRSPAISHATGIPFRKVSVQKACIGFSGYPTKEITAKEANAYSIKATGKAMRRSITNLDDAERWIAPDNLTEQLAEGIDIRYGNIINVPADIPTDEPVVSTLPMPVLLSILGTFSPKEGFGATPITTIRIDLEKLLGMEIDLYQTMYLPTRESEFYRASITGKTLILETSAKDISIYTHIADQISDIIGHFGLVVFNNPIKSQKIEELAEINTQRYGKITPHPDPQKLRDFIVNNTRKRRLFSLGRFATWRNLLMDDLVQDINVIESLLHGDGYAATLKSVK